jgi:hypothetical protein
VLQAVKVILPRPALRCAVRHVTPVPHAPA